MPLKARSSGIYPSLSARIGTLKASQNHQNVFPKPSRSGVPKNYRKMIPRVIQKVRFLTSLMWLKHSKYWCLREFRILQRVLKSLQNTCPKRVPTWSENGAIRGSKASNPEQIITPPPPSPQQLRRGVRAQELAFWAKWKCFLAEQRQPAGAWPSLAWGFEVWVFS